MNQPVSEDENFSRTPLQVGAPKDRRGLSSTTRRGLLYYWIWQACVAAFLLIAVEFLRRVAGPFHAYNREQFHIVRWCIGTSLLGGLLISIYARYQTWRCGLKGTLIADALISLMPSILAILAHFTGSSLRIVHSFNLYLGIFLLAKYAVLTFFACQNAIPRLDRWQGCYLFASTLIVLGTFARWYNANEVPEADESHYSLLTYSLIHDHDFDLTNNYAERDYTEQFPPHIPNFWVRDSDMDGIQHEPHVVQTFRGQRLLWHDIGLPILLVPGYALGKRLGTQLTIAVIAALLPVALVDIAVLLGAGVVPSIVAATVFALTPPVYIFAQTVFPEIVGGAGIAWIALAFLKYRRRPTSGQLLQAGILFALLPWICVRFWVLEFPLFLVIATYLVRREWGGWMRLISKLLLLGSPIVLSLAIFGWFDHVHFNTYLPNAGYRILQTYMPQFWNKPYLGLLGLLFDRTDGLAPIAPLYVAGLAGLLLLLQRDRWGAATLILPCAGYIGFLSFSQYWWGGWNPAGRYLLSAIVLLIPAAALVPRPRSCWLLTALAVWTLVIDLILIQDPHRRWPSSYEQSGLVTYLHTGPHILGYRLLTVFPNLMKPAAHDYVIACCWLLVCIAVAYWLAPAASQKRIANKL